MKKINFPILIALLLSFAFFEVKAQVVTVDEILDGYFENTGGKDAWLNLKGTKTLAKLNQGGLEIPLEIVQLKDGRQYTKISIQGTELYQGVYDGETLWSINFQAMQPEKAEKEATDNFKLALKDFPSPFLNYKDKGYTVELAGTETIDGTETYKLKLTKDPKMIDGKETEDVSYYFFDKEAFILLAQETAITQGPQAGQIGQITMSDYDEVDGLYFPFSVSQGLKGGASQPVSVSEIQLNPEVDASVFAFPGN